MPEDGSVALAVESGDVAPVDGGTTDQLTDQQRDAFWEAFTLHYTALVGAARAAHVPVQDAHDVVHTVALRVLDSYDGRANEFPTTESSHGRVLMASLRKYAVDYHGRKREKMPVHRNWGDPVVPKPGGRRSPDRALETVFGIFTDEMEREMAAPDVAGDTTYREMVVEKVPRAMDPLSLDELATIDARQILGHRRQLSAKTLRTPVTRFDCRRQRAQAKARQALFAMIDSGDIPKESRLRETIEALEVRRLARNRHRAEARARGRAERAAQQAAQKEQPASDAGEAPANGKKRRGRKKKRASKKRGAASDNGKAPTRKKKKGL